MKGIKKYKLPLILFFFGEGEGQRKGETILSRLHTHNELNTGLDPTTPKSRSEWKSKVGHLTN